MLTAFAGWFFSSAGAGWIAGANLAFGLGFLAQGQRKGWVGILMGIAGSVVMVSWYAAGN